MKKITLRTVNVQMGNGQEPIPLVYAQTLKDILSTAPRGGFGLDDIRALVPIVDRLTNAFEINAGFVLLEEAQHKRLLDAVKAHRFGMVTQAILDMVDELEQAPDVEVQPTEET